MEKDWDVSGDPALQRVLNLAKMLGKAAPPRARSPVKKATFGLNPTKIRRLVNPKAPVKCCRVTLHRNIGGYGNSADIPKSQRIQIETLMKKVMGVAYMPEELTGMYQNIYNLNQRRRINLNWYQLRRGQTSSMSFLDWTRLSGKLKRQCRYFQNEVLVRRKASMSTVGLMFMEQVWRQLSQLTFLDSRRLEEMNWNSAARS